MSESVVYRIDRLDLSVVAVAAGIIIGTILYHVWKEW